VAPLGQANGEVHGDRRLADAALARRHEQDAGAVRRVGERDGPALGVSVGGVGAGRAAGVAVELGADRVQLLLGHDRELQVALDAQGLDGRGDPVRDLLAEGAPGHGEGHGDADPVALDVDPLHHPEVDDAAVELRVLHRPERVDDLGFGDGHRLVHYRRGW
jgi:hypothetical protein